MKIAIITPSFCRDLQRCKLLCKSIDRHVQEDIDHYLIIDKKDIFLFEHLENPRRNILISEEILPWWLCRMPFSKRWWISLRSHPVRNWILQQILKLSVNEQIDADIYMFVDSDVLFIKPLLLEAFVRGNRVRLFRVPEAGQGKRHLNWHRSASQLLGLETTSYFGSDYIGNLITWRRDSLLNLQEHISKVTTLPWQVAVARKIDFSEYILYGVYSEFVQAGKDKHFFDERDLCHCSWHFQIESEEELDKFITNIEPWHVAILIQSNLKFGVKAYLPKLKEKNLV